MGILLFFANINTLGTLIEISKKAIAEDIEDIVPEVVAGVLMNVDAAHSATGLEVQIVCQQNLSIFFKLTN